MNPLREAAQQALEALEKTHTQPGCEQWQAERKASVALRAALEQKEQPEQERPEPRNQCGETCERAKLCAVCAKGLAQQEQEPVAYTGDVARRMREAGMPHAAVMEQMTRFHDLVCAEASIKAAAAFATQLRRETEQEPVAWMVYTQDGKSVCVTDNPADFTDERRALPLFTHPPRREWQSLTDEEIGMLYVTWDATPGVSMADFARAIEAALKEKNQ